MTPCIHKSMQSLSTEVHVEEPVMQDSEGEMVESLHTNSFLMVVDERYPGLPKRWRTRGIREEEEKVPQWENEDKVHSAGNGVHLRGAAWSETCVLTWALSTSPHSLKPILRAIRLEFDEKAEVDRVSGEVGDMVVGAHGSVATLMLT